MENKKIDNKEVVESNYKINLDFFNFIKVVNEKKLKDIELIKKEYNNIVNLNWSNRKNIIKRSNRKEVEEKKNIVLKNLGVDIKDFNRIIEEIKVSEKSNNYF